MNRISIFYDILSKIIRLELPFCWLFHEAAGTNQVPWCDIPKAIKSHHHRMNAIFWDINNQVVASLWRNTGHLMILLWIYHLIKKLPITHFNCYILRSMMQGIWETEKWFTHFLFYVKDKSTIFMTFSNNEIGLRRNARMCPL